MSTTNNLINFTLDSIIETTHDHNELIKYFKTLELPTLEHINVCSSLAIQELNSNSEDMRDYFSEFDSIYDQYSEDLVVERIELLEDTLDLTDRKEALYLKKWLNKQRKFGLYK